jgi:hypothetical protein
MTAQNKPARLLGGCARSKAEEAPGKEKRVIGVSREAGSEVCLGRVGGGPHNLVKRPQINKPNTRKCD